MIVLNAHQVAYSLPGRELLSDIHLTLKAGDKVGLVGRNGSGKTTLLRILSGNLKPDSGEITLRGQTTIRYLEQMPDLIASETSTLREVVCQGAAVLSRLRHRYEEVCQLMEHGEDGFDDELDRLTDELTRHDAWDLETRADTLLTTVGFPDPLAPFKGLSGGEKKRIALAQSLLVPPDILLLDEPTNHLDIATIAWLEEFLRQASFTVLMVTHDRFFLERICDRICEVSEQTLFVYSGNYSHYLEAKAEREATRARQQERFDNIVRQETDWLRQGPKARSTRQKARLKRVQSMLEQGSGVAGPDAQTEDQAWDLGTRRLGKKVLTLTIERHKILKPYTFQLEPGERVGLVGANGSGKTTFLQLLSGAETPQSGSIEVGETVSVGYFDQHTDRLAHLPPDTRVLDAIKDVATSVPLSNGKELTAARLCEMFLFVGPQQATPIERLSGGERKRLELLRILMARPNLLLADEPTNDLDIDTLSRLEFFLDGFPGCLCVASHDRFLLQRLCDRILIFRDGVITESTPAVLDRVDVDFFNAPPVEKSSPASRAATPPPPVPSAKRKLSYKETSELKRLEEAIPVWEAELEELDKKLSSQANNYTAVRELFAQKQALEQKLEKGLETWAELEELKESLQN